MKIHYSDVCYSDPHCSPNHSKTGPFKIQMCLFGFQIVWQNGDHLSGFQMVGLLYFRSHSKSGLFATQPLFGHQKSRLVQITVLCLSQNKRRAPKEQRESDLVKSFCENKGKPNKEWSGRIDSSIHYKWCVIPLYYEWMNEWMNEYVYFLFSKKILQ